MSKLSTFCKNNCSKLEKEFIEYIIEKYEKKLEKILITRKKDLFDKIIKSLGKRVVDYFLTDLKKSGMTELVYNFKKFILENLDDILDISSIPDKVLIEIEKVNKLKSYSLLEEKIFYKSHYYKKYGGKYSQIYKKILKEVLKSQNYKNELNLSLSGHYFLFICRKK